MNKPVGAGKRNPPGEASTTLRVSLDILAGAGQLLLVLGVLFLLALRFPALASRIPGLGALAATRTPAPAPPDEATIQIKLADLSSGLNLLTGRTANALRDGSYWLVLVYETEATGSAATSYRVKVVQIFDAKGAALADFGPDADAVLLALTPADFDTLIRRLPKKLALYLTTHAAQASAQTPTASTTPEERRTLRLSRSDLAGGENFLTGQTAGDLGATWFELTIIWQEAADKPMNVSSYHDVQVVSVQDAGGERLPEFAGETASLDLSLIAKDFSKAIQQLQHKKAIYLAVQSQVPYPIAPPPAASATPRQAASGQAVFDIPLDAKLKSDLRLFHAGDDITIILTFSENPTPDSDHPEFTSAAYPARIVDFINAGGGGAPAPPYAEATALRISLGQSADEQTVMDFATRLSSAVAIYLIQ